ncbi:MAG: 4Fe-4S dicluster domain-containing protein [Oscillospiraceae bacterium]|nr:4Fe-4S dicluster domain-containing protein [Oscillospiraceae bacterium]
MKKLTLSKLNDFFAAIAAKHELYIPCDDEKGIAKFASWQDGMALSEKLNTVRSAKDLFFPQVEQMVDFKVSGKEVEIVENRHSADDFVLFGVKACDLRGFEILDMVFLSDPVDTFYKERRDHGIIVTMACGEPEETCFCHNFGIDAANPMGDVTAWKGEECLYLRANTEKGEALLEGLQLEDCDESAVKALQEKTRAITEKLPIKLDLNGFDGEHLMEKFNDPAWAELSEACLGCGTCTFVCPTCQCYDVRDFDKGGSIQRYRCWDSCMYSDFTMMAHGTNRPTQKERFRQRFMHKLVYFPSNNSGVYGCVGCGRCLQKCPIHMNIVKVAKKIGEGTK